MTEPLQWAPPVAGNARYCEQAGGYSVCRVGSAQGWTFEVWKAREQLQVGLATPREAKQWAQRHQHCELKQQGKRDANSQPA